MLLTEWNWDDAKEVWQEEAREDGIEIGIKRGLEMGRTEGREEGRSEEKLGIARKMKEMGDAPEKIHVVTGLSLEQIKQV